MMKLKRAPAFHAAAASAPSAPSGAVPIRGGEHIYVGIALILPVALEPKSFASSKFFPSGPHTLKEFLQRPSSHEPSSCCCLLPLAYCLFS